jgi:hypothetical protein
MSTQTHDQSQPDTKDYLRLFQTRNSEPMKPRARARACAVTAVRATQRVCRTVRASESPRQTRLGQNPPDYSVSHNTCSTSNRRR